LAGRILARARADEPVSEQALSTAQRIEALPAWVALTLERHKAPYRVARWIAWGEKSQQQVRADFAVLIRNARPTKGWPDVSHLKAAFDVYLQTSAAGLGVLMSKVPVERYLAAIDALPKRRRRRPAEESDAPPAIVAEDDVLRALVEARPPRRSRPPVIKLRTTPLRTGAEPATSLAAPAVNVDRVLAENARLRAQRQEDELEAERQKELHRRELAQLTAKVEALERARSGGPPAWVVLGSAAAGAVATEIVRRGVDLLRDGDTQAGVQATGAAGSLDGEALLERLLPVFDNLARAQQHAGKGAPAAAIAEGLRIVQGQLDEALARSGVERVPTVGQLFDPSRHTAVEHVEAPEPAGTVLRELLPGYMAGGRLLRAASVVVSKGRSG
jgi:molecular chaperone GrpE